jgi:hypothetical protein
LFVAAVLAATVLVSTTSVVANIDDDRFGPDDRGPLDDTHFLYSTFAGGSGADWPHTMALGPDGSVYVAGYTESYDFYTTDGAFQRINKGQEDVFVIKLAANGSQVLWSTLVGGSGQDIAWDLGVATDGHVWVTGHTTSTDFPTTRGAVSRNLYGERDAFVICMDAYGTALNYSTYLGGEAKDTGHSIIPIAGGTAYVAGQTESLLFPTSSGVFDRSLNGASDIFITSVSSQGTGVVGRSTFLGGDLTEGEPQMVIGKGGLLWVAGWTTSDDFPATPGVYGGSSSLGKDMFVSAFFMDLSVQVRSTFFGSVGNDVPRSLSIDADGNVLLSGYTSSPLFPTTPNAISSVHGGDVDGFLLQLDGDLMGLQYGTYVGGDVFDMVKSATTADDGTIRVTGYTNSSDFPTTPLSYQQYKYDDDNDAFYMELHPDGSTGNYSTLIGRKGGDFGMDVALDHLNLPVIVGHTRSSDFPVTPGGADTSYEGGGDTFILRFTQDIEAPEFDNDTTPDSARTGETITFGVDVTDDMGVVSAIVEYWFDERATKTVPMEGDGSYTTTITVATSATTLNYFFYAMDPLDRYNRTDERSISILDTIPPQAVEDRTPGETTTGDRLELAVRLADNIGITEAWAEFELQGVVYNGSMEEDENVTGSYGLSIDTPGRSLEPIRYRFAFSDAADNWERTGWTIVTVRDDDAPILVQPDLPEKVDPGGRVEFSVSAEDNIGITAGRVEYSFGPGAREVLELAVQGGNELMVTIPVPQIPGGDLVLNVIVEDEAGNNATFGGLVLVIDEAPPEILSIDHPVNATTGDNLTITWEAQDPSGIKSMVIRYIFGVGHDPEDYWPWPSETLPVATVSIPIPVDSTEPLYFYVSAFDMYNNMNATDPVHIPVLDDDPPTADAGDDIEVRQGEDVLLDARGCHDNLDIEKYVWSWYNPLLDRDQFCATTQKTVSRSFPPGEYVVTLMVQDTQGNIATDTVNVTVIAKIVDDGRDDFSPLVALIGVAVGVILLTSILVLWWVRRTNSDDS